MIWIERPAENNREIEWYSEYCGETFYARPKEKLLSILIAMSWKTETFTANWVGNIAYVHTLEEATKECEYYLKDVKIKANNIL